MLEVWYEDLVARPEATLRAVLAHLGLRWHPACLDFWRSSVRREEEGGGGSSGSGDGGDSGGGGGGGGGMREGRRMNTASLHQIRKPLYQHRAGFWRTYDSMLRRETADDPEMAKWFAAALVPREGA